MNIVILGAPGAGKGTQAKKITDWFNIPHISTGDIFRRNIKERTPVGVEALKYIEKGNLVPDDIVVEIVRLRLEESDCQRGYLLDGFPRTLNQAKELDKFACIDKVINLDVDLDKLLVRIVGRRVCNKCGESYHVSSKKDDICDRCGEKIVQRDDDREDVVKSRLDVYVNQTAPLIDYYSAAGKLVSVDGMRSIDEVSEVVRNILNDNG